MNRQPKSLKQAAESSEGSANPTGSVDGSIGGAKNMCPPGKKAKALCVRGGKQRAAKNGSFGRGTPSLWLAKALFKCKIGAK